MADYVWTDAHGRGRNRYALFRRSFHLPSGAGGPPAADRAGGLIRIFADTRYRLIVNGRTVAHGPARFFRSQPEYDEVDLTPHLVEGENVVAVVVNSVGAVHFQGEKSCGALVAFGEVRDASGGTVSLDTPGAWRGIDSPAHDRDTHALSFAVGPAEHWDARRWPDGWDRPGFDDSAWPAVVLREGTGYGPLMARSIPMLDERAVRPRRRVRAFAGHHPEAEDVYSLRLPAEEKSAHGQTAVAAAVTYIHSPVAQTLTFHAWWGRYFLAGQELQSTARDERRRRQAFTVTLQPGWTPLVCSERYHWSVWELFLRFPASAGLTLSATREPGSDALFRVVGPYLDGTPEAESLLARLPDLAESPREGVTEGWVWPRGRCAESPHRERANLVWAPLPAPTDDELDLATLTAPPGTASVALLYDLGTEVLGRPRVELTAPAGTRVDLGYTETLAPNGTADLHRHFLVDMAERFVTRDGRQTIHTFHPRGARYLELRFTPAPGHTDLSGVVLHDLVITRAQYPGVRVAEDHGGPGRFECSDPLLNEIWRLGPQTLQPCMEDAYLDCPMRERGLYVGDALVQFHSNLMTFGDRRLFRRCLELFWLSADLGETGLVAGGCHGMPPGHHPDYSALMPWSMLAYYRASGDREFLLRYGSRLERLLQGLASTTVPGTDLVDVSHLGVYIDTATHDHAGIAAAPNAFTAAAYLHGAEIFHLIGDTARGDHWRRQHLRIRQAFHEAFWSEADQAYLDRRPADKPDTAPSAHGNALALLFGLAPQQAQHGAERKLLQLLDDNTPRGEAPAGMTHRKQFTMSSYFSFYALTALAERGHWPFVLEFIRRNWSVYLDAGSPTAWEYFSDHASLCHAWSTCPTYLLSRYALGVSCPVAGDLSRVRIEPITRGLAYAEGVVPHPAGPIVVNWARTSPGDPEAPVQLRVRLPRGVTRV